MPTSKTWNGSVYSVPLTGEENWGGSTKVDGLLGALVDHGFQKTGGTFTLTADADLGGTAGLKALYLKSRATTISATGLIRMENAAVGIGWRNAANNADLLLTVDSANRLSWSAGAFLVSSAGDAVAASLTAATLISSTSSPAQTGVLRLSNTNAVAWRNAAGSADISLSVDGSNRLTFAGVVIASSSGIVPPAAGGTGVANNAASTITVSGAYALTLTLTNTTSVTMPTSGTLATLAGSENLSSKTITAGTFATSATFSYATLSTVPYFDASKNLVSSAVTPTELGYVSGVTSAIQTQLGTKTTYTANQYGVVLSGSSITMSVLAPDSSATKVLKSGGAAANPSWLAYDNANTVSTLVFRDSSGNFSAGTITANLTGNASGTAATFTGALSGDITSSGMVTTAAATQANIVTLSKSTGVAVHGTNTNDSAAAGYYGEYQTAYTSATNFTASNTWIDGPSVSLTAGDWQVTVVILYTNAGATATGQALGISTVSGNTSPGTGGREFYPQPWQASAIEDGCQTFSNRVSLSGTTTVYGKVKAVYSAGTPQWQGRISAVRVR